MYTLVVRGDDSMLLECVSVSFYSDGDEKMFFEWLSEIKSIKKIYGEGCSLFVDVVDTVTDDDLRELVAIFFRYNVTMSQLKCFLTPDNKAWFQGNKESFWYKRVFLE